MNTVLAGRSGTYRVGKLVANFATYRLYLCTQEKTNRQCLLQIAKTVEHNGPLYRAGFLLKQMKERADEVEKEYADVKADKRDKLNYDFGFPQLIDSFRSSEQENRMVNILAFKCVDEVRKMVPLSGFARDNLRIDMRTSVWILGKLLKILTFTHGENLAVGQLTLDNILIEPDQHYVVILDWSKAITHTEEVLSEITRDEISKVAQIAIAVLGGDHVNGVIPNDDDKAHGRYSEHILRLARGCERNAQHAHRLFYELVDQLWERGFHDFTTFPLS